MPEMMTIIHNFPPAHCKCSNGDAVEVKVPKEFDFPKVNDKNRRDFRKLVEEAIENI